MTKEGNSAEPEGESLNESDRRVLYQPKRELDFVDQTTKISDISKQEGGCSCCSK